MNPQQWEEFKKRAGANGQLIELVIKDIYNSNFDPSGHAIDGGAHTGFHTVPLLSRFSGGKVVSVEANRKTFEVLKRNVGAAPNSVLVHAAVQEDDFRPTVTFNCSSSHPGRSGIGRMWDIILPGKVEYEEADVVNATTIDKLVREHDLSRLAFIKLDLEGGEYNALRGASITLAEHRPLVVSEHSSFAAKLNNYRMDDYFDLVQRLGYVPVAPNGENVLRTDPVPFWYVFLVPTEKLEHWRQRIIQSIDRVFQAEA